MTCLTLNYWPLLNGTRRELPRKREGGSTSTGWWRPTAPIEREYTAMCQPPAAQVPAAEQRPPKRGYGIWLLAAGLCLCVGSARCGNIKTFCLSRIEKVMRFVTVTP